MKTIVISIRPEWACKILNKDKEIEVRAGLALYNALKKAKEKGEEVEFLMYVTVGGDTLFRRIETTAYGKDFGRYDVGKPLRGKHPSVIRKGRLNGKVVARFRADPARIRLKQPRNYDDWGGYYYIGKGGDLVTEIELGAMSCLYREQLDGYLQGKPGTALEISGLEILDEPKPLSDFGLKRGPQSWCYAKEGRPD